MKPLATPAALAPLRRSAPVVALAALAAVVSASGALAGCGDAGSAGDAGEPSLPAPRATATDTHARQPCPVVDVEALPATLHGTGLYADDGSIHPCARAFTPKFTLWSDGASKRRFVYLPDGAAIDDSDVDNWQMPVGARLWKEFTRDGVLVETRVAWKTSAHGWQMGAYVWSGDDAVLVNDDVGVADANGTPEDVPGRAACLRCHGADAHTRPLGFSAVQLGDDVVAGLLAEGKLSHTPAHIALPGDAASQKAMGWLHVNCGSCHRDGGSMGEDSPLRLALTVASLGSVAETPVYRTAVGQVSTEFAPELFIAPGHPEDSVMFLRASARDGEGGMQMPAIGSEIVDQAGLDGLALWIGSL